MSAVAPSPIVTVVVAPREKYRAAARTLSLLVDAPGPPFDLVYVDEARAPRRVRRFVADAADRHGFRHITLDHRAGANECRARGFDAVTTPYVFFLDNDAQLGPGSLAALLECAEETSASFVSPVYLLPDDTIHYAGGVARVIEDGGRRRLVEEHEPKGPFSQRRADMHRQRTDAPELHGVLVRTAALAGAGGLDERLESSLDCLDLGFRLQAIGEGGWVEPSATVTYDNSLPRPTDLALYFSRWNRVTVGRDLDRFVQTWGITPGDNRVEEHRESCSGRRWKPFRPLRGTLRRAFGARAVALIDRPLDAVLDRFAATDGSRRTR